MFEFTCTIIGFLVVVILIAFVFVLSLGGLAAACRWAATRLLEKRRAKKFCTEFNRKR